MEAIVIQNKTNAIIIDKSWDGYHSWIRDNNLFGFGSSIEESVQSLIKSHREFANYLESGIKDGSIEIR